MNCHSAITHQGGVDLSAREIGWKTLVGSNSDGGAQTYYVYPNYPQYSPVVNLMNAEGSIRMPPDNPLSQADILLIESWIAAGAQDN